MFTVYENLLPEEVFLPLYQSLSARQKWHYGVFSDSTKKDESSVAIWQLNLMDDVLFTETLFNKICSITNKKFKLLRVYANGQTYGQSGDLHIDTDVKDAYTFLYYVNTKWFSNWGGCTIFTESLNPIENKLVFPKTKNDVSKVRTEMFLPKPNTGLLYKSNVTHAGLEPTRHCKELRITVSYKLLLE